MSRSTIDLLRIPLLVLLVAVVAFFLWPRGEDGAPDAGASPSSTVGVGPVGGVVLSPSSAASEPAPTPVPTVAVSPSPSPSTEPTPEPVAVPPPAPDGFTAVIRACQSISGSTCNGQLGTLAAGSATFTALVTFTDANAGDQLNAILNGPSGTIAGAPYALQGSGDGYYYSQFQAGGLPPGGYTLTATRNGTEVSVTSFEIAG